MAFDLSKFQQNIVPVKKVSSTQSSGHMFLYEALLRLEERVSNRLDGDKNNTAEFIIKLVWWHHASNQPRCTTIRNYASVLHNNELTDFAKILNAFLPPDKQLAERIDIIDLVKLADSVVTAINSEEIYCFCQIDSKQKIGHKIVRFELTDKIHPKLNRPFCDTIRELEWFIPPGYENEPKFQELSKLNRDRYRKEIG